MTVESMIIITKNKKAAWRTQSSMLLFLLWSTAAPFVLGANPRGGGSVRRSLKGDSSPVSSPILPGQCVLCDKNFKNKPEVLVLEYQPEGKDSLYQGPDKASCVGGSYPASTSLQVDTGNGDDQVFDPVDAGAMILLFGPFGVSVVGTKLDFSSEPSYCINSNQRIPRLTL